MSEESKLPQVPMLAEWRSKADTATFLGKPVRELGRDDLLSMIGYMANEIDNARAREVRQSRMIAEAWARQ